MPHKPPILVQCIDSEAWGFLRHRFLRALAGSAVALIVAALLIFAVIVSLEFDMPEGSSAGGEFALRLLVMILLLSAVMLFVIGPGAIGVALFGGFFSALPRELSALGILAQYVWVVVGNLCIALLSAGSLLLSAGDQIAKLARLSSNIPHHPSAILMAILFGAAGLSFFISVEVCAYAWWQLTAPAEGFRAACAWRPSVFRVWAYLRRHMGLPAFLSSFGRGRKTLTLLYFGVALVNTGIVACLAVPIVIFLVDPRFRGVFGGALALLFAANVFGLGRRLARIAAERATNIYQDVRAWDSRPPVLFLRAFTQDDDRVPPGTRDPLLRFTAGVAEARTLDEILLEHASPYGPVIAIGNPADPIPSLGAARIFVKGEGWQDVIASLADASKAIVMCPNVTEGVRWELNLIGERSLFPRTIFLANPERAPAETIALFREITGLSLQIAAKQIPVALFFDAARGARLLTAACLSSSTYTVALNLALIALFGDRGVPLAAPWRSAN